MTLKYCYLKSSKTWSWIYKDVWPKSWLSQCPIPNLQIPYFWSNLTEPDLGKKFSLIYSKIVFLASHVKSNRYCDEWTSLGRCDAFTKLETELDNYSTVDASAESSSNSEGATQTNGNIRDLVSI